MNFSKELVRIAEEILDDGETGAVQNLKECPFCGGDAEIRAGRRYGFWAQCVKCGATCSTKVHSTKEQAAEDWNRRK